jgi:hypothetical protein
MDGLSFGSTLLETSSCGPTRCGCSTIKNVSPRTALSIGLKVDSDALPPALINAIKAGQVNLVTIQLLKLNAVTDVIGKVIGANDNLATVGITCPLALCDRDPQGLRPRSGARSGSMTDRSRGWSSPRAPSRPPPTTARAKFHVGRPRDAPSLA